ncbi:MAG: hypothetical protein ACP6IP_02295 [Candidatus Njordarchaeia archaeon]
MVISYASIAPHGDEIVEELFPKMGSVEKKLSEAMWEMAEEIYRIQPETIIIATPHNLRIHEKMGIIITEYIEGLRSMNNVTLTMRLKCDRDLARFIYEEAKKIDLPVVAVNYGTAGGELSTMCMDWGTFIPLWFVYRTYQANKKEMPKVVVITPSREIPGENLVKLGEIIVEVSNSIDKKIVFIASADQAHAHDPNGPYGFDEAAEEYDKLIQEIVSTGDLERLLSFDPVFIEKAKPDSFWQMLILHGVLKREKLKLKNIVYGCPTYFGMLVATFQRE